MPATVRTHGYWTGLDTGATGNTDSWVIAASAHFPKHFLRAMHPRDLAIADFTYTLPPERIAQHPLADRDASRLLVYRDGSIEDRRFGDLPDVLPPGALLVMNDTRVVNARLLFQRSTGARIEVLCLEPADGGTLEQAMARPSEALWRCMIGNANRWEPSEVLTLGTPDGHQLRAERSGSDIVRFTWAPSACGFAEMLERFGHVPLPPYMKRPDENADRERYNTVFARHSGSVAAPTASLHFSPALLDRIGEKGVTSATLTLHVGAGTFAPVKSARMEGHHMHSEQVRVPAAALASIGSALEEQRPIVAVGTTALRSLESLYWHGVMILQGRAGEEMDIGQWEPYGHDPAGLPAPREALAAVVGSLGGHDRDETRGALTGQTRSLIAPGYKVRFADALITNFHQPDSTLLLLVAAFIGPAWRQVYDHALAGEYRFLSYGDGSLLWRDRRRAMQ